MAFRIMTCVECCSYDDTHTPACTQGEAGKDHWTNRRPLPDLPIVEDPHPGKLEYARVLFAEELRWNGEHVFAARVLDGTDNSLGGTAAIRAMMKLMEGVEDQRKARDAQQTEFSYALTRAINSTSRENGSNTPDFLLADFLEDVTLAFERLNKRREKWYGENPASRSFNIEPFNFR